MSGQDPGSNIECVVASRDLLGETPLWCDETDKLWWIDVEDPRLQSFDPATGTHRSVSVDCTYLGSLALTADKRFLIAKDLSLFLYDPSTEDATVVAEIEQGLDNRLNDGRVDGNGRFWVGTMDNQLHRPNGSLYRVDPQGTVSKVLDGIVVSNGIAHSPDNRTLYFSDTRRFLTWAFDVDPGDGAVSNQRIFADYSETGDRPDGACVDVDGCLWTAFFAGAHIVRYRPDGRIDRKIGLPVTNPTCVCFGGTDFKTLYITTASKFLSPEQLAAEPLAGNLLAIHGVGQGLPENRFGSGRSTLW
jgi:sugar lactone lactonase YvrE